MAGSGTSLVSGQLDLFHRPLPPKMKKEWRVPVCSSHISPNCSSTPLLTINAIFWNSRLSNRRNSFWISAATKEVGLLKSLKPQGPLTSSAYDRFASEIYRILKPGGSAIISTENGSSWHNIFASILGWQIFSLTNVSRLQAGIGNPLALLRNQPIEFSTWTHKVIFNYRGLKEFFLLHGFKEIQIKGAGYYPFPTQLAKLDPRHSHFITLYAKKPA